MGRNIEKCDDKKLKHTRERQRKNQANCLQRKRDQMEEYKKTISKLDSDLLKGFDQFDALFKEGTDLYKAIWAYYQQTDYMDQTAVESFEKLKDFESKMKVLKAELERFNEKETETETDSDQAIVPEWEENPYGVPC